MTRGLLDSRSGHRRPLLAAAAAFGCLIVLYGWLALLAKDATVVGVPGALPFDCLASAAVGAIILHHRRGHTAGWIFLVLGGVFLIQTDSVLLAVVHYQRSIGPSWFGPVAVLAGLLWVPGIVVVPPALAAFPDGRLGLWRSRTTTVGFALAAAATCAYFYAYAIQALVRGEVVINPATGDLADFDNPRGALGWWYGAWATLVVLGLTAAVIDLARKYRRGGGETRQQLRWFLFGAALVVSALVPIVVVSSFNPSPPSVINTLLNFWLVLALAAMLAAVAVGLLKFRLYDLNVIVARSVAFALLAAVITTGYLALVALLGLGVRAGNHSLAVSTVATFAVAAAFQPLRSKAERLANRVVYGRRATPYDALRRFAEELEGAYDVDTVLQRAARLLVDATGAERAEVWLCLDSGTLQSIARWPEDDSAPIPESSMAGPANDHDPHVAIVAVRHRDTDLGALSITKPVTEPVTSTDLQFLHLLGAHAGLVLHNAQMTKDLQRRLIELAASRRRLVSAQDEARRLLERDLHDGAQQQLIALSMKLSLLRSQLEASGIDATVSVDALRSDLESAIDNLRVLSRGFYPALLTDRGLLPALRSHVREAPIPVAITGSDRRWAPQIETALYFCVLEGLQNAYRHATATRVSVTINDQVAGVEVEIVDNGQGFEIETDTPGSGLANIRDRVEMLGGEVTITSRRGEGCRLLLDIPTATPAPLYEHEAISHAG